MRKKILRFFDLVSNFKWKMIFLLKKITDSKFRITINLNKKLENNHKGKRCFIVGNGPSLKKMDLSHLTNEIVFTVNSIMTNKEIYDQLNSDYHVIIDHGSFKLDLKQKDDRITRDLYKKINYKSKKPICIVDYAGKLAFDSYGLDDLNKYYIYLHSNLTANYRRKIKLSGNIPTSQNVIHAAIFSAISMGIKKIYLVGCDMTSVFLNFESDIDGNITIAENNHAYNYTDSEKKRLLKDFNILDNEEVLHDYAKTFTIFKNIRKYCEKNDIEIYNATSGGGLDVFKRIKFESLFNKGF